WLRSWALSNWPEPVRSQVPEPSSPFSSTRSWRQFILPSAFRSLHGPQNWRPDLMALVEIRDVSKKFGELEVLKGISLDISQGEIVTIIGKSGSGKSTLLRCINALEHIDEGEIRIDWQRMATEMPNLRQMRQKVGIVFQAFNLFPHMTIERNVTQAPVLTGKTDGKAARALAGDVLRREDRKS